jgi:hypothetical protein
MQLVIFLHNLFDNLKQLIEYVGIAWHIAFTKVSLAALLRVLGVQPRASFLILVTMYSKSSSDDLPTAVGNPRYFSILASVAIPEAACTTAFPSVLQLPLKKIADFPLFTICLEPCWYVSKMACRRVAPKADA